MLIEQGAPTAVAALEQLVAAYTAYTKSDDPAAIDESWIYREPLAIAYVRADRIEDASLSMHRALISVDAAIGEEHPAARRIRIELADIERARGNKAEAWNLIRPAGHLINLGDLPEDHPAHADLLRVTGLLQLADGDVKAARIALTQAQRIFALRYGDTNWRTQRTQDELDRIR
jgi:tetratricopeptide (TPR) repeat protein